LFDVLKTIFKPRVVGVLMSIKSIDNQLPGVPLQPNMLEDLGWAPAIQKPAESDGQTSQPKSEMCRKNKKKR
jgi:hypothetical protein